MSIKEEEADEFSSTFCQSRLDIIVSAGVRKISDSRAAFFPFSNNKNKDEAKTLEL